MTTWGLDASYFQRPRVGAKLDLRTLPAQGYEWVTARISYGASFADPAWPVYRQQAAQTNSLLFNGYHFLTGASAQAQADFVASHIGDKRIPVAVDYEAGSKVGYGQVEKFATAVESNGLKVGKLYFPRSWWLQVGRPTIPSHWGLWNAGYPSSRSAFASLLYPGDGHPYWQAYGGHAVNVWQFASTALLAGYTAGVDVNAYRGTRAQLASTGWFHDFTPAPPTPPPPPKPPVPPTPENAVTPDDVWNHLIQVSDDPKWLDEFGYSHKDGNYRAASLLVDASWRARDLEARLRALEAKLTPAPAPQPDPAATTAPEVTQ